MGHQLEQIQKELFQLHNGNQMKLYPVYPGINLSFLTLKSDQITLHHDALSQVLEINYCKSGRIGWNMANGNTVYLGPGDYSLHTMDTCADSLITLPNGTYEGFTLFIHLDLLAGIPLEFLTDTGITGTFLCNKFCKNGTFSSFGGNAETESIFSGFYNQPQSIQLAYWKIKIAELLLYLGKKQVSATHQLTAYRSEQIEVVRKIHEQLTQHMEQRFTIDSLAKEYLMNPTTLKTVFKAVYGNSLAAHIKEHRMEKAAELLRGTQENITVISKKVGYENQSKFTSAFKEYFQMLPTQYRKKYS